MSVQVKIDVEKIKSDVQTNVISILGKHFEADEQIIEDDSDYGTYTISKNDLENMLGPYPIIYDEDNPPTEDDFDLPDRADLYSNCSQNNYSNNI